MKLSELLETLERMRQTENLSVVIAYRDAPRYPAA